MDSSVLFSYTAFSLLISSLLLILTLLSSSIYKRKHTNPLPPTPPSLPILGHLHLFKKPLHRTLARLSSLHRTPLLFLRFGSRPLLVVSSLPLFDECFTKNDVTLASRPQLPSSKSITYNYTTLASAPYGPHWRNIRRIATIELLSTTRLHSLSDIRHGEVKSLIHDLYAEHSDGGSERGFTKLEMRPRLFGVAYNVMMRMIAGKRGEGSDEASRFRRVVEELLKMIGASNASDFLPVLRWVDFGGVKRRGRRVAEMQEAMLQGLIDEKRRQRENRVEDAKLDGKENKKKGILEVLLDLQEEAPEYYSDEIIKAMIVTLFAAGTDTSTVTLEWAMTLLVNHPGILKKARDEIDSLVGSKDRLLHEHDVCNLPYLQAIVSETFRLCPATPLLVPHESLQACTVGGYHVPCGTMILVNAWAIHRDPSLWAEPAEFRPERFLNGAGDGTGGCGGGKIISFGMGRRRCPGEGLATRMVSLVLGTLIQCFEWERIGEELVDMQETGGLTLQKANPLQILYRPRPAMINVLSQT